MRKYTREILWGMFALYAVCLLWVLFFSREAQEMPLGEYLSEFSSFVPFRTTARYIKYAFRRCDMLSFVLAFSHIGGNLFLFLPMGFFLPQLFSCRTRRETLLRALAVIVAAEMLQAFFRLGVPDVDDVIYNFFGTAVGYGINLRFREYISIVP